MKLIPIWLFITVAAVMPYIVTAQRIRLVSSTAQRWSGGVAGRTGSRYSFVIRCSGIKGDVLPDTLWIENQYIPLSLAPAQGANTKRTTTKKAITFEITVSTVHDEYAEGIPGGKPGGGHKQAPISYQGIALLSYKYRGARRFYCITRILKDYPAIAYP